MGEETQHPMAARYERRPMTVQAVQWTGHNLEAVQTLIAGTGWEARCSSVNNRDRRIWMMDTSEPDNLWWFSSEGSSPVGTWIVRDDRGRISRLNPESFAAEFNPHPQKGRHEDTRIAELEREVERYKLLLIEATNPGIDMEDVRRRRAGAGPP